MIFCVEAGGQVVFPLPKDGKLERKPAAGSTQSFERGNLGLGPSEGNHLLFSANVSIYGVSQERDAKLFSRPWRAHGCGLGSCGG